jgi:hypothetical protein
MHTRTLGFLAVATAAAAAFAGMGQPVAARETCRRIFDPRWPGLQECVVRAGVENIVANPPERQKLSLWCWAAALSMIYGAQGHPISQESIVRQNFGELRNAPGGDFLTFVERLNRPYTDDRGERFLSTSTEIETPEDARNAMNDGLPILYTTSTHAMVQTSLTYQVAPGYPVVFKGGILWDPASGRNRNVNASDVVSYVQAWLVEAN